MFYSTLIQALFESIIDSGLTSYSVRDLCRQDTSLGVLNENNVESPIIGLPHLEIGVADKYKIL